MSYKLTIPTRPKARLRAITRTAPARSAFRSSAATWAQWSSATATGGDENIWPHNVDRVEYIHMTDDAALAQALIGGRIDFLPDVPPNQLERLRQTPGVKVLSASTVRSKSLGLNWGPDQLETSSTPRPNPFRDRRVREAIYRALDMEAFCSGFMHGMCVPAGMLAAPGVNGYSAELDRRLPFDPERAKALLAEAGLSGGFDFRLDCDPEDRAQCAELAAMLSRVGITVRLGDLDHDVWVTRMYGRAARRLDLELRARYPQLAPDLSADLPERRPRERRGLQRSGGRCGDRRDREGIGNLRS